MTDDQIDAVSQALRQAWQLGQTYWQQADSQYASMNRKSDETRQKFLALVDETKATLSRPAEAQPVANFLHDTDADLWTQAGKEFSGDSDVIPLYRAAQPIARVPIKGAWIDGGYVIVTPSGSGNAQAVKDAILALAAPQAPAVSDDADERELDAHMIDRMSKLLAEISLIIDGEPEPRKRRSYHDLPDKVRALQCEAELLRAKEAPAVSEEAPHKGLDDRGNCNECGRGANVPYCGIREDCPHNHPTARAEGGEAVTAAARDVLAERRRQVNIEGWTPAHDDGANDVAALADAAACYVKHAGQMLARAYGEPCKEPPKLWPWDASWWKPTTPRRDLVKAGALILAEIERIDRAAPPAEAKGGEL